MANENILNSILCKLKTKPLNIIEIKESVNNYENVINLWNVYKKTKKLDNIFIERIFKVHLMDEDHIILYHSKDLNSMLIMCKINSKYKNIEIPYVELNEKLKKMKHLSFIAFYM
jgi:hypothetical protein